MTTELTTNDLNAPRISGMVEVSLADLDKLRSDHANAIKLAQDLEERQSSIRIDMDVVNETMVNNPNFEYGIHHAGAHIGYESRYKKEITRERIVSYKNLDEVIGPLKADLEIEYSSKIVEKRKEISSLKEQVHFFEEDEVKFTEAEKEYVTSIKAFEKDAKEHKKVMKTISRVAVIQADEICDLLKELNMTKTKLQIAVFKNTDSSSMGKVKRFFNI